MTKLEEMTLYELRQLEATLVYLLEDIPDMTLSELQDKILDFLEKEKPKKEAQEAKRIALTLSWEEKNPKNYIYRPPKKKSRELKVE